MGADFYEACPKAIKKIQEVTLPNLRQQLAETTGILRARIVRLWKSRYSRLKPNLLKNWIKSPIFCKILVILCHNSLCFAVSFHKRLYIRITVIF